METQTKTQTPEITALNLAACDRAGIVGSKRAYIANLPHVTPEFIDAHTRQANAEKLPLGSAISRIEKGWKVNPFYLFKEPETETKIIINCDTCKQVNCVCGYEEEEVFYLIPIALDVNAQAARKLINTTCQNCHAENIVCVGIKDADICFDCFDAWRYVNLGIEKWTKKTIEEWRNEWKNM